MSTNWTIGDISQGINSLQYRINEALNRSTSATLHSHRSLTSPCETAPEVNKCATPLHSSQVVCEADLYRSIQNYQVKTVHGVDPSYFVPQPQYHGFAPQPVFIQPYGHQFPVQEVRSATYGYEPYIMGHPYHPLEVTRTLSAPFDYVDDYEGALSQRNQSSGKKRSTRSRRAELQNDEDSFSKDKKPQDQPAPKNAAPQNQSAQPANPQNNAAQSQAPQQNNQQKANPQPVQQVAQNGQPLAKKPIEKGDLVILPKKPYLVDTYNFGQEQRRGGSTK